MGSYLLDSPIHDHCGITGVYSYSNSNVTTQIVQILEALQHRGQESVGLAVDGNPTYTRDGLVYNALLEDGKKIDQIKGHAGIGHVRYSTSGKSGVIGNFHPIPINSKIKMLTSQAVSSPILIIEIKSGLPEEVLTKHSALRSINI